MIFILKYWKQLAAFAVAISLFFAGWLVNGWRYEVKILEIEKSAQAQAVKMRDNLINAMDEGRKREKTILADSDNARAAVKRLQDTLRNERAKCTSHYTDALKVVFSECAGRYIWMAEQADRCASERQTLVDGWPRR